MKVMKDVTVLILCLVALVMASCEVIGDIFSAGFYTALILVLLVVAIVVFIISRFRRGR